MARGLGQTQTPICFFMGHPCMLFNSQRNAVEIAKLQRFVDTGTVSPSARHSPIVSHLPFL